MGSEQYHNYKIRVKTEKSKYMNCVNCQSNCSRSIDYVSCINTPLGGMYLGKEEQRVTKWDGERQPCMAY